MNTTTQRNHRTSRGFSLIEILLIIVVIGAITAVAIPKFVGYSEKAFTNSAKRTAQILAATAESARVAGDVAIYEAADKEEAIQILHDGVQGSGIFEGVIYKVTLNPEQRMNVLPYLEFEEGILQYAGEDVD